MNNLEIISIIKRENLDERNYFNTLIQEAYNKNILNGKDIDNIQTKLLLLLDKRVYRYNGLESSSIRKELLEQIQNSNLYTIGIYLKTFENPDEAVSSLKENEFDVLYSKGRKKIDRMLNIIRFYFVKINQNKLNVGNETYDSTLLGGIKGFLKIYNPDFDAQNMKITADYPLYNNLIGKLDGVDFIEEYIKSIYLENEFCKLFSEDKIKYLLYSYSNDYKELIINIFEIVLAEIIGCILANEEYSNLAISETGLQRIYKLFEGKSKEEIYRLVSDAIGKIKLQNKEIEKYINKGIEELEAKIYINYKSNNLNTIFITPKYIVGGI